MRRFAPRGAEIATLRTGQEVWRIYFREPYGTAWNTFRHHGPMLSRFDHHARRHYPGRSILYAADHHATCAAEVFQDQRLIDTHTNEPWLVRFAFHGDLRLLDLTGAWPTRAKGSMAINSGDRETAQSWSRAIYDAFGNTHGLRYASATHSNRVAYAFYDRARPFLESEPRFHVLAMRRSSARLRGWTNP